MAKKSSATLESRATEYGFYKSELSNGVRVLTEQHTHPRAVSLGVWILTGTRHEPPGQEGISHLLEHLVFKGTKKRSAFQIAQSLECLGGELNAYTTREYTCYHALVLKDHWRVALDVLCDLVSNMKIKATDFDLEKGVILQEIAMSEDNLDELVFDLYFEEFLKGHPLATPILGSAKSIEKMKQSAVVSHYKGAYQGPRIIVSVAGPVEHHEVVKALEPLLSSKEKKATPYPQRSRPQPKHRSGSVVLQKDVEQLHFLLGLPSASFNDRTRFEAFIVNALLGGGMTSKLFQSIREKRGLAYSVFSSLNTFTDFGLLSIYAASDEAKAKAVMNTIRSELQKLRSRGIRNQELDFFKTQVRGSLLLGSDDMENRMSSIAVNEMVFGRYRPVEEIIQEVEAVNVAGVDQFLHEYFDLSKMGRLMLGGGAEKLKTWFEDFDLEKH